MSIFDRFSLRRKQDTANGANDAVPPALPPEEEEPAGGGGPSPAAAQAAPARLDLFNNRPVEQKRARQAAARGEAFTPRPAVKPAAPMVERPVALNTTVRAAQPIGIGGAARRRLAAEAAAAAGQAQRPADRVMGYSGEGGAHVGRFHTTNPPAPPPKPVQGTESKPAGGAGTNHNRDLSSLSEAEYEVRRTIELSSAKSHRIQVEAGDDKPFTMKWTLHPEDMSHVQAMAEAPADGSADVRLKEIRDEQRRARLQWAPILNTPATTAGPDSELDSVRRYENHLNAEVARAMEARKPTADSNSKTIFLQPRGLDQRDTDYVLKVLNANPDGSEDRVLRQTRDLLRKWDTQANQAKRPGRGMGR